MILAIAAGCAERRHADYRALQLADVRGTITLDSRPLAGARVVFESEDRTFSYATTDAAGRYRLRYNSEQLGVKLGRKTVRITLRLSGDGEGGDEGDGEGGDEGGDESGEAFVESGGGSASGGEPIPARYNIRSQLNVQIDAAKHTFDFDLTSSP